MITKDEIFAIAEPLAQKTKLFVTEVKTTPSNDIEITVDGQRRLTLDDCATLSKEIEKILDEKYPDFSLTLFSSGIGTPLSDSRQFEKIVDRMVEVLFNDGRKLKAQLVGAQVQQKFQGEITVMYKVKELAENKKKKVEVEKQETINLDQVKSICELLEIR
ncbi:MAG: ribosome assembly cofactor RimP [Rikenellaceae bacterium]